MNIVTTALPYANGSLHLGHFYEAVCADILVRHLNSSNRPTLLVSGDDCHGAATTLYCQKHQLDVESHLLAQHQQHKKSYTALGVHFDNFGRTNTPLHHWVVGYLFDTLHHLTYQKEVESWYDPIAEQFLPDRYVRGICPHCNTPNQTAEICEHCGQDCSELVEPKSAVSDNPIERRLTTHLVLNCENWPNKHKNYIDISRDKPYYGIDVPGLPGQCFYVWFDAPLAYLTLAYEVYLGQAEPSNESFKTFLSQLTLEHFIGKDIIYFHEFFWKNLLKEINPDIIKRINLHGWITNNGAKLSKSQGDSFVPSNYSAQQIDAIRLYFFSHFDNSVQDFDYSETLAVQQYNSIIVNSLSNFYARATKILDNNAVPHFKLVGVCDYKDLWSERNYKKLFNQLVIDLNQINSEFQASALWTVSDRDKIQQISTGLLNRWYSIYETLRLVCISLPEVESTVYLHLAKRI